MTNESYVQMEDLQKTVLIPVLSLRTNAPQPVAATISAVDARTPLRETGQRESAQRKATAADSICEIVLRESSTIATPPNPIVATAANLTMMASRLHSSDAPENLVHFSQLLIDAIREFDRELVHTQVNHDSAVVARYILCCLLDEAVLSTHWGLESGWAHRSLLRLFHNEANGGDRFFSLLEHAIRQQKECRDLLELFYLCLALGFEGKLHLDPRGQDKIETLRAQLYRILYSGLPKSNVPGPNWRTETSPVESQRKPRPPKFLTTAIVMVFIVIFTGIRLWLHICAGDVAATYDSSFQLTALTENQ